MKYIEFDESRPLDLILLGRRRSTPLSKEEQEKYGEMIARVQRRNASWQTP